jgi:hypothetical protein
MLIFNILAWNKLIGLYIYMGGFIQKLIFKSGSEGLKAPLPKSFFDFKVNDIYGK